MGQSLVQFRYLFVFQLPHSLCNKLAEFHDLLEGKSDVNYDIICVSETWLSDNFSDSLLINNCSFSVFRCDRLRRSGGGCAIFVSSNVTASRIVLPPNTDLSDSQIIAIEIFIGGRFIAMCCIYNPPGNDVRHVQNVCNVMNFICEKYCNVCILGDFNFPLFVPCLNGNNPFPASLISLYNTITNYSLNQLVAFPTRGENILDLIFCSPFLIHSGVQMLPSFSTSDHCCLSMNIFVDQKTVAATDYKKQLDFMHGNYDAFNMWLSSINWGSVLSNNMSVEEMWQVLMHIISDGLDKFVPFRYHCNSAKTLHKYPPNILKLQAEKRRLWRLKNDC